MAVLGTTAPVLHECTGVAPGDGFLPGARCRDLVDQLSCTLNSLKGLYSGYSRGLP